MNVASFLAPAVAAPRRRWWLLLVAPVVIVLVFLAGYWPRRASRRQLVAEASAARADLPRVEVATAEVADGGRALTLPGSLMANHEALINARATGYVARFRVDIGDRVRAGDVLAEIDTPDLDQQLYQARAALKQKEGALEQAMANRDYAQVTASRQDALLVEGLSAQQTDDQARAQVKIWEANVHAAQADVAAAQASVRELAQLVSFARVVAPFDGRITQRNIDVGSLVTAGGAPGASTTQPLFRIEATDPIRVFVEVPQAFASSVEDGQAAGVSIQELPGRVFTGRVTRTAGTLDPSTRTLNVEVDVPNPRGELLAGMYAEVKIAVAVAHPIVRVPASAVIVDSRGVHVATVDGEGSVRLVEVSRGLDDGREIEVLEGLAGGEQIVVSPGGGVTDGMRVEPVRGS
jgi:membrane fusion protein (multidrug efflux system)